jgi:hypothetical protein
MQIFSYVNRDYFPRTNFWNLNVCVFYELLRILPIVLQKAILIIEGFSQSSC